MDRVKRCCRYCDHVIAGRTDKLFCNAKCRNAFHRQNPVGYIQLVRPILYILKKNQKILQEALSGSKGKPLEKQTLTELGFNPFYCTEHKEHNGIQYYFCFDVGYSDNGMGQWDLIKREDYEFLSQPLPENLLQMLKVGDIDQPGQHLKKIR